MKSLMNSMFLTRASLVAGAMVAGLAFGALSSPKLALAQGSCEDDRCSSVCFMGTCTGSCYDAPGSGRQCAMNGGDCSTSGCLDQ